MSSISSSISNILLDKEILLESGTNELELLVFNVADYTFGINVAKVREVLPTQTLTRLPRAHRSVRGVFKLRNQVVPCVSLYEHLSIERGGPDAESNLILTDFNQQQTAFLVDSVERIHRLSWEQILSMPPLMVIAQTPVTAIARCDGRLIVMLDFEMIIDQVTDRAFRTDAVENPRGLPRETLRVVLADDSPTVREAVANTLRASGYTNLRYFENGGEAWRWIETRLAETGDVGQVADLIISDVEMPQVDGFHLTKRVKEHPRLNRLPVLLYSSIVTPDNLKKGQAVGADAQIAKPELSKIVELADELISAARGSAVESSTPPLAEISPATQPIAAAAVAPAPFAAAAPQPAVAASASSAAAATQVRPVAAVPAGAKVPGGDTRLWNTFQQELAGHLKQLRGLAKAAGRKTPDAAQVNTWLRTLHTIKSASMVVPVEEVAHATHLLESLIEAQRQGGSWQPTAIDAYLNWLGELLGANDPRRVLDEASGVQAEIAVALAATAR
ncbi:MAG: chemotaxis protein CheW [Pirellulales bacterium]|nr:chemotaxis protein CheW [Pirellulales bacterium]